MSDVPRVTLNTGATIPLLGLGCWVPGGGQGERAYEMCRKAIDLGYRHLDTAANYVNEENVGQAIRDSSIPRSEFFVTTKLDNNVHGDVSSALDTSLSKLGLDYVDLYLIHWPQAKRDDGVTLKPDEYPTINDTWAQMEKVFEEGKAKAIGVSNFSVKTLERLEKTWKVVPAVNQVEMHPFLPWNELKTYCDGKGIHLTAYSPLGRPTEGFSIPSLLKNDLIVKLAEKYGVTPGQILLGWGIQRGTSVIPKSESEERLRQNITLVKLEDEDVKAIDKLHT
ncbi:Aldo/keto reductase [Peniophora sp. CONT]|nr:Aldo/keto reductase [Peniophora sp. CONT]